jgi:hypothetical protein
MLRRKTISAGLCNAVNTNSLLKEFLVLVKVVYDGMVVFVVVEEHG